MIKIGPRRDQPPAGTRNSKKNLQISFNNHRSSIEPESAPDPKKDEKSKEDSIVMSVSANWQSLAG